MTQDEAMAYLFEEFGVKVAECTGDAETCPVEECALCGVRDCPDREPLHFHHDGCPACVGRGGESVG